MRSTMSFPYISVSDRVAHAGAVVLVAAVVTGCGSAESAVDLPDPDLPAPIATLEAPSGPLAIDDEAVYVLAGASVHRIDKGTLESTTVLSAEAPLRQQRIRVSGGEVFVEAESAGSPAGPGSIVRFPARGGESVVVAPSAYDLHDFAVDEAHVYWTNGTRDKVLRVPRQGASAEPEVVFDGAEMLGDAGHTDAIEVGPSHVYVAEVFGRGVIVIDKPTLGPRRLPTEWPEVMAHSSSGAFAMHTGGVVKKLTDDQAEIVFNDPEQTHSLALAAHGDRVAYMNAGSVMVFRLGDEAPTVVAEREAKAAATRHNVALDETHVYWLLGAPDGSGAHLFRAPLP